MALNKQDKEKLINLMRMGLSEDEALKVIEDDKRIDRGEKLFELTDEQKANEKKARLTGERATTKPTKRERKVDTDKAQIINLIKSTIEREFGGEVELINTEREFNFKIGERKFKIVLSCPRT